MFTNLGFSMIFFRVSEIEGDPPTTPAPAALGAPPPGDFVNLMEQTAGLLAALAAQVQTAVPNVSNSKPNVSIQNMVQDFRVKRKQGSNSETRGQQPKRKRGNLVKEVSFLILTLSKCISHG